MIFRSLCVLGLLILATYVFAATTLTVTTTPATLQFPFGAPQHLTVVVKNNALVVPPVTITPTVSFTINGTTNTATSNAVSLSMTFPMVLNSLNLGLPLPFVVTNMPTFGQTLLSGESLTFDLIISGQPL